MWNRFVLSLALGVPLAAQIPASATDVANLREDVRGLTQRVGELMLRLEQLERENAELRTRATGAERNFATVAQLNDAVAELNRTIRSTSAASKTETLQQVATQLEKLGKQTQAAIDSALKPASPVAPAPAPTFTDDYPKEGVSYKVEKGDTLAIIAKKTGAKPRDIINANKLVNPSQLAVGQTLFIPGGK